MSSDKGFSLIELMVTEAIVGVLASAIVPAVRYFTFACVATANTNNITATKQDGSC
jgi:prepilin-type N-terminal cleavage/methylation domain-containing protein